LYSGVFPVVDPELFFFRELLFPDRSFSFYPLDGFAEGWKEFGPVGRCDDNVDYVFSGFDNTGFVVDQDFEDAFFLLDFVPDFIQGL